MPPKRRRLSHSLHNFSASGVRLEISSLVIVVLESGGGLTGNGSVGEYHSPGVSPLGTGRSSTPNIGLPVLRSRINNRLILLVSATAGMVLPSRLTSINAGGAFIS